MGIMTGHKAGQGETMSLFEHGIVWLFMRCKRHCIVMLENARSVILHEMINDLLCMNPLNAKQQWPLVKTITWMG